MRRLEAYIPIVLLAIMVQLMAPIAAFRVVAYATSDPLYMSATCSDNVDAASAQDNQTGPVQTKHAHDCCAFCGAGHVGVAAITPPTPIFVSLQREYQLLSWLEATDPMPALRVGSNAQARAPPTIS
jgi:hypothetical protein